MPHGVQACRLSPSQHKDLAQCRVDAALTWPHSSSTVLSLSLAFVTLMLRKLQAPLSRVSLMATQVQIPVLLVWQGVTEEIRAPPAPTASC